MKPEEQSCQSHKWCEVSLKIDRATVVSMSRSGVREHSTKRNDGIIYRPCTTHHNPPCLGGASHGWVPVNTHGTPVLTSVRRPWVAQPRPRAHASDTRRETRSASNNGGEHRDGWRPNSLVAEHRCRSSEHGHAPGHESAPATWECASRRNMVGELCCRSHPTW